VRESEGYHVQHIPLPNFLSLVQTFRIALGVDGRLSRASPKLSSDKRPPSPPELFYDMNAIGHQPTSHGAKLGHPSSAEAWWVAVPESEEVLSKSLSV
jgi:hypothetical protein